VRRVDNLTTFMCRLSRNPGALTSWTPQGHVGLFWVCFTSSSSLFSVYPVLGVDPGDVEMVNYNLTMNTVFIRYIKDINI
jgi:hypothetical protein